MLIKRPFDGFDEIDGVLLTHRFYDGDDDPTMVNEVVSTYLKLALSLTE